MLGPAVVRTSPEECVGSVSSTSAPCGAAGDLHSQGEEDVSSHVSGGNEQKQPSDRI